MFQSYKVKIYFGHKKSLPNLEGFLYLKTSLNYLACLAYLVLNLSIRPAVSINLDLPV